jgi:CRISPR-associated protein Cas1
MDFSSPELKLKRGDNLELREKILNISYSEWQRKGYSKGTLHYLRKNVRNEEHFRVRKKVKEKILLGMPEGLLRS